MDGENNGKPYFLMDDLGGNPTIFGNIHRFQRPPPRKTPGEEERFDIEVKDEKDIEAAGCHHGPYHPLRMDTMDIQK